MHLRISSESWLSLSNIFFPSYFWLTETDVVAGFITDAIYGLHRSFLSTVLPSLVFYAFRNYYYCSLLKELQPIATVVYLLIYLIVRMQPNKNFVSIFLTY